MCFKEGNCIAILDFVLQRFRLERQNCIAICRLYCDREVGWKGIVLQGQVLYRDIGSLASREVSCDTARCRATIQHAGRTVGAQEQRGRVRGAQQERWHGAGQQAGACVDGRGAPRRARGVRARGRRAAAELGRVGATDEQAQARAAGEGAAGARAAWRAQQARPCAAWAWPGSWLGMLAGSAGPVWVLVNLA